MELKHGKKMREQAHIASYEDFFGKKYKKALSGLIVEQRFPWPPGLCICEEIEQQTHSPKLDYHYIAEGFCFVFLNHGIWKLKVKLKIKDAKENSKTPRMMPECLHHWNSSQWSK